MPPAGTCHLPGPGLLELGSTHWSTRTQQGHKDLNDVLGGLA